MHAKSLIALASFAAGCYAQALSAAEIVKGIEGITKVVSETKEVFYGTHVDTRATDIGLVS
jgi:hypothetical protein